MIFEGIKVKICNFYIPSHLQNNEFIQSLQKRLDKKGKLSINQYDALIDILEIELDFYDYEYEYKGDDESLKSDFEHIRDRLRRNNFRAVKPKNRCIRAINSIIRGKPDYNLINMICHPQPYYGRRR